jgi:hypothetical protein
VARSGLTELIHCLLPCYAAGLAPSSTAGRDESTGIRRHNDDSAALAIFARSGLPRSHTKRVCEARELPLGRCPVDRVETRFLLVAQLAVEIVECRADGDNGIEHAVEPVHGGVEPRNRR